MPLFGRAMPDIPDGAIPRPGGRIIVRPSIITQSGIIEVHADQSGFVDQGDPAKVATSGNPSGEAKVEMGSTAIGTAINETRAFYRLTRPITEAVLKMVYFEGSLTWSVADSVSNGKADGSLIVEGISDATLDLDAVTWNNQANLTYLDLGLGVLGGAGVTSSMMNFSASRGSDVGLMSGSVDPSRQAENMIFFATRFFVNGFRYDVPQVRPIYGVRISWKDGSNRQEGEFVSAGLDDVPTFGDRALSILV